MQPPPLLPLPDDPRLLGLIIEECSRLLTGYLPLLRRGRELRAELDELFAEPSEEARNRFDLLTARLEEVEQKMAITGREFPTAAMFLDLAIVTADWTEPGNEASVIAALDNLHFRAIDKLVSPADTPTQARDRFCAEQKAADKSYFVICQAANRRFPDLKSWNTDSPDAAKKAVERAIKRHKGRA